MDALVCTFPFVLTETNIATYCNETETNIDTYCNETEREMHFLLNISQHIWTRTHVKTEPQEHKRKGLKNI